MIDLRKGNRAAWLLTQYGPCSTLSNMRIGRGTDDVFDTCDICCLLLKMLNSPNDPIIDTATSVQDLDTTRSVRHTKLAAKTTINISSNPISLWQGGLTIPLDQSLGFFHFSKQVGVSNDPSGISDFSTSLVQSRDYPHDSPFRYIRQLNDLGEWLPGSAPTTTTSGCEENEEDVPFP